LAAELLDEFEPEIEAVKLVPSDGGRFEISVNGDLIYSKLQTHRHTEPGEAVSLVRQALKNGR
jgi:selenoprotein W-related protein